MIVAAKEAPPAVRCDQTSAWHELIEHHRKHGQHFDLRSSFSCEPHRVHRFGIQAPEVFADLSRSHWNIDTQQLLLKLARECGLERCRDELLGGAPVNSTEGRAALHTALRAPRGWGPFSDQVHSVLDDMLAFADRLQLAADGGRKRITDVVNIGIGGSDLGSRMAVTALREWMRPDLTCHFVSNIDGQELVEVLKKLDHERTLFVVASKTFTTQETMANAIAARQWYLDRGGNNIGRHFVAVTTNKQLASEFGIEQTFGFWDWVGGRYSMWSAIGLPIALALGSETFRALLDGAHAMDRHFAETPLELNLPVLLGVLDVWNRNFLDYRSRCFVPYHHGLRHLPSYLQQLMMESNGKHVDTQGNALPYATSDVLWGSTGTNGQHAYFQMLHQGSDIVPVEFLLVKKVQYFAEFGVSRTLQSLLQEQHRMLLANGLAQAQALMWGRSAEDVEKEKCNNGPLSKDLLARHRVFQGNRPSLTLLLDTLTPRSLGALAALMEHRTFVSATLWGINPFDQWGVELGKTLCQAILPQLQFGKIGGVDAASAAMISRL